MHYVQSIPSMSDALPIKASAARRCNEGRLGRRWLSAATALLLAACVHSPQAAVSQAPEPVTADIQAFGNGAAQCTETPATRTALQGIERELKAQGLAFRASCPTGASRGGWVIGVRVVDGLKATKLVRGPLADGHDVDMGTPPGVPLAGAEPGAQGFSPDVQHNREWLRSVMARHQFDNLPDAWWHFAQRGARPTSADTDVASR